MAFIEMTIRVYDGEPRERGREILAADGGNFVLKSKEQGEQLSREVLAHFKALARENPDATASADALAHPEAYKSPFALMAMTSAEFQLHLANGYPGPPGRQVHG